MQSLLDVIESSANEINMSFNTNKTVCMVFNPINKRKLVCISITFPAFRLAGCHLLFVEHFKYLGHIIDNDLNDDSDIRREIKYFKELIYFPGVSSAVHYKSNCSCFAHLHSLYDSALSSNFIITAMAKFKSCYHKIRLKHFLGYLKYSSVTNMLFEAGLPFW